MQLYRYGMLPKDLYLKARESKIDYKFEMYRDFIISILKITPSMNDTAVLYRVKEQFDDFDMAKNTFFRHLKELREDSGYIKPERKNRGVKEETLPGAEAQADFGQHKMVDMYGKALRVYFFVMVLSYSRMKFCYFSREPFTTKTAILAHEYAFRYFGGRTQVILYDQDRLFLVSDNFGDFILVKEFEDFVRDIGFSAAFCHKHDPDSKGKIENVVNYIKTGFLKGRTYEGIDSLNSACLDWLDRFGNGDYHSFTKKIPSDMFREVETKTLVKVKPYVKQTTFILTVDQNNAVRYKNNRYGLDYNLHLAGCKVRVTVTDDELFVYKSLSEEMIAKFKLLTGEGHINTCKKVTSKESIYPKVIQNLYGLIQM